MQDDSETKDCDSEVPHCSVRFICAVLPAVQTASIAPRNKWSRLALGASSLPLVQSALAMLDRKHALPSDGSNL